MTGGVTGRPPLPPGFLARPFAHRALHGPGRAENSAQAIDAAVAAGWGVEIDVQLTADGRAAVFHDEALYRLTGRVGRVRETAMEALGAIPLSGGGTIPSLDGALARIGGRVPVLIEVKDQSGAMSQDGIGPLERAVAGAVAGYGGPVAVMSFNPHSVAALGRAAPGTPRGMVTCDWAPEHWPDVPAARRAELRAMPGLREAGCAFVSHDRHDLAAPQVARARAAGLAVLTWTVRSADEARRALAHADQITFEGYAPAA